MDGGVGPVAGSWWRFDRYQVDADYIRPAPEAKLERYDPWAERDAGLSRRKDYQPPYITLARLGRELDRSYIRESSIEGAEHPASCPANLLKRVAEWCSDHGLAGSLLHTLKSVTLADRWMSADFPPSDPMALTTFEAFPLSGKVRRVRPADKRLKGRHLVPVRIMYEGSSTGWTTLAEIGVATEEDLSAALAKATRAPSPGDTLGADEWPREDWLPFWPSIHLPPPGKALTCDIAKFDERPAWRLVDFADRDWAPYFPSVTPQEAAAFEYPVPCSEEFWRLYAEPLDQFHLLAHTMADVLDGLSGDYVVEIPVPDVTMNRLLSPIQPMLQTDDDGHLVGRWFSPSLVGTMALMAFLDLTGWAQIEHCDECGGLFVARRTGTSYCSPQCKARARKHRQREDPSYRARERARRRELRQSPVPPARPDSPNNGNARG